MRLYYMENQPPPVSSAPPDCYTCGVEKMPTYLVRDRDRNYGLRRRVPDELRPIIGKREVLKSYGAVSFADAKRRHPAEVKAVEDSFAVARRKLLGGSPERAVEDTPECLLEPTESEMRAAIMEWFHAQDRTAIAQDAAIVEAGKAEVALDGLRQEEVHLAGPEGADVAERRLRGLLRHRGFALPSGSLCSLGVTLVQNAMTEAAWRSQERMQNPLAHSRRDPLFAQISGLDDRPAPGRLVAHLPAAAGKQEAVPADRLLKAWAAERRPAPATLRRYQTAFRLVSRVLGIDDLRKVTPDGVIAFKTARLNEGTKPKTVAHDVLACGAVCKWAVTNKLLERNPFSGLAPRVGRQTLSTRDGYDDKEAACILGAARAATGALRWLPWLLCFTGARIEELAGLRRRDVRQEQEVWILDIVPTAARQGKNATFQRMIPLHPAVIAEGFLDYLASVSAGGPLFPDLSPRPGKERGRTATNIHARWLRGTVGITDRRKAPAHSWRHRMEDELRKVRALPEIQDALTGRHNPRNAGAGYGKGFRGMPWETINELAKIPTPLEPSLPEKAPVEPSQADE